MSAMSAIPQVVCQDQAAAAPPPSYGDTVKSAEAQQGVQPQPSGQQLPQGYVYPQQPVQQVQYMVPAPVFQQQPAVNKPDYPGPHDFLIVSIVVTTVCLLLNLTSLGFGIPAMIFAILSNVAKNNYNYDKASKYARTAIALVIINIVYTLAWSLLIIGLITGIFCPDRSYCN